MRLQPFEYAELAANQKKHDIEISWSSALIELEGGGFDDVPTKNLIKLLNQIGVELDMRLVHKSSN